MKQNLEKSEDAAPKPRTEVASFQTEVASRSAAFTVPVSLRIADGTYNYITNNVFLAIDKQANTKYCQFPPFQLNQVSVYPDDSVCVSTRTRMPFSSRSLSTSST